MRIYLIFYTLGICLTKTSKKINMDYMQHAQTKYMRSGMMPHLYFKFHAIELFRIFGIIFLCATIVMSGQKAYESIRNILQIQNYGVNMARLKAQKDEFGINYVANQNKDFVAWISVKDLEIELPIVNASSHEQEDFYLTHDFWGYENPLGCPYQTINSNINQTDNTSIAGHSTYNFGFELFGSTSKQNIFGNFIEYLSYNSSYDYQIIIETNEKTTIYKVFACIIFEANSNAEASRLYNTTQFSTESQFNSFCSTAKNLSNMKFDIPTTYGKKLITTLTCAKTDLSKRILTIAIEQ